MAQVLPYKNDKSEKRRQVAQMFDNIAKHYDFLNILLSAGIDRYWRRQVRRMVKAFNPTDILDVATGTGDLAIALSKIKNVVVTGVDISAEMMKVGAEKVAKRNLSHRISFQVADAEKLPFEDGTFDVVTVAFGVRNFQNPQAGLADMRRTLRRGGALVVLEFSKPSTFPVKQLFGFYSKYILPAIGKLVSGDGSAYTYLPESVAAFPESNEFLNLMARAGFIQNRQKRLSAGIVTIYIGTNP